MVDRIAIRRVLIFHVGQLGDSVAALPAFWAVREHYRDARITLLTDHRRPAAGVPATAVIGPELVDDVVQYAPQGSAPLSFARLTIALRRNRYQALVYLAPSRRTPWQVRRDRLFFRLCGIRRFLGMRGPWTRELHRVPPLPELPREADQLLARLSHDGIPVPGPGTGRMEVPIGESDRERVRDWLAGLPGDEGRPWLAVGPGSKMPAKIWPMERFVEVLSALIGEFDCWPVIFGGPEDVTLAGRLLTTLGRGYSAAGVLNPREAAVALQRCVLYLGNDSGAMHLAAAAGLPCVAIFSSRDWPGRWAPYGAGHRVFRTEIACEGCMLVVCAERGMECILRIRAAEVTDACRSILADSGRVGQERPAPERRGA